MNILITGGLGFVGKRLARELLKHNHKIVLIDNLSNSSEDDIVKECIFYKMNVEDSRIKEIIKENDIKVIYHFAAQKSVEKSENNPILDANSNIVATLFLLENLKDTKVEKFIFSSTAAVYGNPKILPIKEDDQLKPICNYGISKKCAEEYISHICKMNNIKSLIFRYANIYGQKDPCVGEQGVIAKFLQRIKNAESLDVFSSLDSTRDYIHIDDITSINLKALSIQTEGIYNVGTNLATSLKQLIETLEKIYGFKISYNQSKCLNFQILHSYFNNEKLVKDFNVDSFIKLEDGILKILSEKN